MNSAFPDYKGIEKLVVELIPKIREDETTLVEEYNLTPYYMDVYRNNVEKILDELCLMIQIPNTNHKIVGAMWTLISDNYLDTLLGKFVDLTVKYSTKGHDLNDLQFSINYIDKKSAKLYAINILENYKKHKEPPKLSAECSEEGLDEK